MGEMDTNQTKELLAFMTPDTPAHIRSTAMEYFLGMSGSDEGRAFLRSHPDLLSAIVNLFDDKVHCIQKDALMALINMTTSPTLAMTLLDLKSHPGLIKDLLKYVLKPDSQFADVACMALSNFSRTGNIAKRLVKIMEEDRESVGFGKIIEVFCTKDFNKKANLNYLGTFLWNLTQLKEGRRHMLDKDHCVIQRLMPYTQFESSKIRRGGAVGVLYNCCFEPDDHEWLLSEEVDILPRLLLPLAGPEEFDEDDMEKLPEDLQYLEPTKTREPDPDIRRMLVDAINQLCATKPCRLYIRGKNAYVILRELHQWETDPATNSSIMNVIQVLLGDEPEAGMEDLNKVVIPENIQVKLQIAWEKEQAEIEEETKKLEAEESDGNHG